MSRMPAVHIAGPDLSFGSTRNLALEEEALLRNRRGRTPAPTATPVDLRSQFRARDPQIPDQAPLQSNPSYSPPASTAGVDAQGRPISVNPDAPPPSTPGTDSAGRPVSTNPSAGTPVAPPAKLPEITNKKIKAIDDEEEGQHQLLINRQRRRQERDALTSTKAIDKAAKMKAAASENAKQPKGNPQPIRTESYPGEEDNTMGPHALNRTPLQQAPYNASQPSPSSAPPPSLSAHPNDPPQSFAAKYAALQQMKSMGLDPSSPKDRTEYERLKHLRGVR